MIDIQAKLESVGFIIKGAIRHNKFVNCAHISNPKKKDAIWYRINETACNYGSWNGCIEKGYFWLNEETFQGLSYAQQQQKRQEQEQHYRQLEQEDNQRRMAEVSKAYNSLNRIAINHPYLQRKQALSRHDFKLDFQGRLVIPSYNIDGTIVGYQYIAADGSKKFKTGSISRAAFYPVMPATCQPHDLDLILLAEGYATASSIYQALNEVLDGVNYGVFACFSAGQLDNVHNAIIQKFKHKQILAIQDNDMAGICIKTPGFTVGFESGQDANDIAVQYGLPCLQELIMTKLNQLS